MSESHKILVYAHSVEIGKIGSEEYVQIKRDVRKTPSIYLMQTANLLYAMMLTAGDALIVTPICIFWLAVTVMVVDPASANQIVATMHSRLSQAQPLFSVDDIQTMQSMLSGFAIIYGGIIIAVHGRLRGFVDVFDDEISRRIKKRLKQPVYGDLLFLVEDSVGEAIKKLDGAGGGE
jgi:hypothetical protein